MKKRDWPLVVAVLALLIALLAISSGCSANSNPRWLNGDPPEAGAGQWDVVAYYGKPDFNYPVEDESGSGFQMVMEWHEDGEWMRRAYFKMTNLSNAQTGAVRYGWALRATTFNKRHSFFRNTPGAQ